MKTFNAETQVQINVGGVGTREGVELGWSQAFGLDELDVTTFFSLVPQKKQKMSKMFRFAF
jgi:hypothetical protein